VTPLNHATAPLPAPHFLRGAKCSTVAIPTLQENTFFSNEVDAELRFDGAALLSVRKIIVGGQHTLCETRPVLAHRESPTPLAASRQQKWTLLQNQQA
jgi:hypothetical protein